MYRLATEIPRGKGVPRSHCDLRASNIILSGGREKNIPLMRGRRPREPYTELPLVGKPFSFKTALGSLIEECRKERRIGKKTDIKIIGGLGQVVVGKNGSGKEVHDLTIFAQEDNVEFIANSHTGETTMATFENRPQISENIPDGISCAPSVHVLVRLPSKNPRTDRLNTQIAVTTKRTEIGELIDRVREALPGELLMVQTFAIAREVSFAASSIVFPHSDRPLQDDSAQIQTGVLDADMEEGNRFRFTSVIHNSGRRVETQTNGVGEVYAGNVYHAVLEPGAVVVLFQGKVVSFDP